MIQENQIRTIFVKETCDNSICITHSDGQKLFEKIASAIDNKEQIALCFDGVTLLTATFFNAAVGQLYGKYDQETIRACIKKLDNIDNDDKVLIKRVVDNAKIYFANQRKHNV